MREKKRRRGEQSTRGLTEKEAPPKGKRVEVGRGEIYDDVVWGLRGKREFRGKRRVVAVPAFILNEP